MQVVLSIRKGQRQTLMNLTFAWTSNCANRDSVQTECAVTLLLLPFHFRWYRSLRCLSANMAAELRVGSNIVQWMLDK